MKPRDAYRIAGMMLVVALAAGGSGFRNEVWKDELSFWSDVVRKNPAKERGYYNLGCVRAKQGDIAWAFDLFNKAIAINPSYYEAYHQRGNAYDDLGKPAEALRDYNTVIAIVPDYAEAYYDRGLSYERMGILEKARADYERGCERGSRRACRERAYLAP